MKPYWKIWIANQTRMYYREEASWWFCIESIDGEHFVNIPMDGNEVWLPLQVVIGRFFKDVVREMVR